MLSTLIFWICDKTKESIKSRNHKLAVQVSYIFVMPLCISAENLKVRLKGGHTAQEGRVEILKNGSWGTICGSHWGIAEASVVCRMLDYAAAEESHVSSRHGPGSGDIYVVSCWGIEPKLGLCNFSRNPILGFNNCTHQHDASVKCSTTCKNRMNHTNTPSWVWSLT